MVHGEKIARKRCEDRGYDPDYVGPKGYPNWHDYRARDMRERIARIVQMSVRTAELSDSPYVKEVARRHQEMHWSEWK